MVADGALGVGRSAQTAAGGLDQPERLQLGWTVAGLAVSLPAVAGVICGALYASGVAQYRGASLAVPTWPSSAVWSAGMATLGLAAVLCVVPWLRRRAEASLVRVAVASLTVTGLLLGLASVALPS